METKNTIEKIQIAKRKLLEETQIQQICGKNKEEKEDTNS